MSTEPIERSDAVPSPSARTPLAVPGRRRGAARGSARAVVRLVVLGAVWSTCRRLLDDPTRTRQWAEYLCYATLAVGIDIAWGYGGMLVLGQGVFFGLGAYAMGMYLSLEQVGPGRAAELHDALQRLRRAAAGSGSRSSTSGSRRRWRCSSRCCVAGAARLAGVLAGASAGPYFAILTQAMALVFIADPGRPAEA